MKIIYEAVSTLSIYEEKLPVKVPDADCFQAEIIHDSNKGKRGGGYRERKDKAQETTRLTIQERDQFVSCSFRTKSRGDDSQLFAGIDSKLDIVVFKLVNQRGHRRKVIVIVLVDFGNIHGSGIWYWRSILLHIFCRSHWG